VANAIATPLAAIVSELVNRIDASIDFFAIAPPSTDRVFGPGGEREDQSLLTWPLSTGLNLGWQATTYQRISGQYLFRFDGPASVLRKTRRYGVAMAKFLPALIDFRGWPYPGYWGGMQEVVVKK